MVGLVCSDGCAVIKRINSHSSVIQRLGQFRLNGNIDELSCKETLSHKNKEMKIFQEEMVGPNVTEGLRKCLVSQSLEIEREPLIITSAD